MIRLAEWAERHAVLAASLVTIAVFAVLAVVALLLVIFKVWAFLAILVCVLVVGFWWIAYSVVRGEW